MDVGDQTPDMALVSGPGEIKRLSDWGARPIVLIFLRHLACLPCQAHLVEVRGCYQEILRLGAEVVVVSFEPVERLPAYRRLHGWPFPVVSDPSRAAYRAFGLGSAGWGGLLKPRVAIRYAQLMLQGFRPRPSDTDVHQLGGDFVLDARRRVVYASRSNDPADRPPASALVSAVAAAAARHEAGGTS